MRRMKYNGGQVTRRRSHPTTRDWYRTQPPGIFFTQQANNNIRATVEKRDVDGTSVVT